MFVLILAFLVAPRTFAGQPPPSIPKTCDAPEQVMSPEELQDAIANLIKSRVIEYQIQNQRFMLKDTSALEQLRRSNRVNEICALATVVCWFAK